MESAIFFLQLVITSIIATASFFFLLLRREWVVKTTHRIRGAGSRKQAPQPPGALPFVGHLHLLWTSEPIHRLLGRISDAVGPSFLLHLGSKNMFVVSTWEAAQECFTNNDQALATRPTSATSKYLAYDGAVLGFAPYGPLWREVRKIATLELLSLRRLDQLKHVRAGEVHLFMKELYQSWAAGGGDIGEVPVAVEVDLKQRLGELMFNVIVMKISGKRYFGKNTNVEEGEARWFRDQILEVFRLAGLYPLSNFIPWMEWADLGGCIRDMKRTHRELDLVLSGWIAEHRREREQRSRREVEARDDFIHVMMSALEDAKLSDYDDDTIIKGTCLAMILGGNDTSGITLTWAVSLLLNHPCALQKARDELDFHVGRQRNVDESDVKKLAYIPAIIKETLRLYPAVPLAIHHQATTSCYIDGYHIPAGTWLAPNLWKIQRDPRKWAEPEEFRPERFLAEQADVDYRGHHFDYIPFGSGRRSCPGISFAEKVMTLTLARLLQGFDLAAPTNEPVDMVEGLGMTVPKASPLHVLITPRLPFHLYE